MSHEVQGMRKSMRCRNLSEKRQLERPEEYLQQMPDRRDYWHCRKCRKKSDKNAFGEVHKRLFKTQRSYLTINENLKAVLVCKNIYVKKAIVIFPSVFPKVYIAQTK